jgi:hypothetical protein
VGRGRDARRRPQAGGAAQGLWAPRGRRPIASRVRRRYEWAYTSTASSGRGPGGGLLAGDADGEHPSVLAGAFALRRVGWRRRRGQAGGAGPGRGRLARRQGPEGARGVAPGVLLPARSPELQPAERLWSLVNEGGVANRSFEDLEELERALVERCLALSERPDLLRGHTSYRWWPEAA